MNVRFNVGCRGLSGLVVLILSFVGHDPTRTFLRKPALALLCSLKTFRKNLQNSRTESPRRATKDLAVSLVELKRRQSVRAFARSMGRADALKMGVAALQFWSVNSHLG